ncbi:hypothetical protein OE88DRAFT_851311 [Heliocybe sulcata]|uniref:F-box domain-containing protein n=1 Tax=Heliocybe sulcata TaxID=5364 RepID=A0A5C3MZT7_9AGAM|nr:hypothetical protein OE88DRAFT_851311 [Heliocybe sulcata]
MHERRPSSLHPSLRRRHRAGHPTMDYLPVELVERICLFACCDGGRTACSLRCVSRSFYDLSGIFRFHTVSITSEEQILSFRDALNESPANVRHLFIAVYDLAGMGIGEAVGNILRDASSGLETLTCLLEEVFDDSLYTLLLSTCFPRLHHLTLRHPRVGNYLILRPDPDADARIIYPELRALHVYHTTPCSIFAAHGSLSAFVLRAGSKLAHLRASVVAFTGKGSSLDSDMTILRAVLALQSRHPISCHPRLHTIPNSVRTYIIEPCYPPKIFQTSGEEQRICDQLEEVRKENEERGGTRLVILPARMHQTGWCHDHKPAEEWREQWVLIQSGKLDSLFEWTPDSGTRPCRGGQYEEAPRAPIRNVSDVLKQMRNRMKSRQL